MEKETNASPVPEDTGATHKYVQGESVLARRKVLCHVCGLPQSASTHRITHEGAASPSPAPPDSDSYASTRRKLHSAMCASPAAPEGEVPELLPCPFEHIVKMPYRPPYLTNAMSEDKNWSVYCPMCSAATGFHDYKETAVRYWNTRLRPDSPVEEVERLRAEIDAFWTALRRSWDIEPRTYFETEAPKNGFEQATAMAVHHMWKREAKVEAAARQSTQESGGKCPLHGWVEPSHRCRDYDGPSPPVPPTGPCSPCGDGDVAMKFHSHDVPPTHPNSRLRERDG